MIITCPACSAQYTLPDNAISEKGRRVKCTTCNHTWLQAPLGKETAELLEEQIHENFSDEQPSPKATPKEAWQTQEVPIVKQLSMAGIAGIAAAAALVLVLLTSGFLLAIRQNITAAWPPMALFYQSLGFEVPAPGIDLALNNINPKFENGVLDLKGTIKNNAKKQQSLYGLKIRVSDAKETLKEWPIDLGGKLIQPGEAIDFQYKLPDVPEKSENVTILFTE